MTKNHYDKIEDWHQTFIEEQMMFFAATAGPEGRVNMAPKDAPSLRVMGPNRIVWVNLTGAENETGAHLTMLGSMYRFGRQRFVWLINRGKSSARQ